MATSPSRSLPPHEVEELRRALDRLTIRAEGLTESTDRFKLQAFGDTGGEDAGGEKVVQQIAEPHELAPEWMALARDPRVLDVIEDVLGPNILLYYSMLMMKPARQGFRAPWHQDFAFFVHDRTALVAVQLYLDVLDPRERVCSRRTGKPQARPSQPFQRGPVHRDLRGRHGSLRRGGGARTREGWWDGHLALPHAAQLAAQSIGPPASSHRVRVQNPAARLLGGSFSPNEIRPAGLMVRGHDPTGSLLSAV